MAAEVDQALIESASEVLETMFFTSLAEEGEPVCPVEEPCVCARMSFHGRRGGRLGIRVPVGTAREIAANFLGIDGDELTQTRVDDVTCELTNMVCGMVLGRLEGDSLFHLSRPEIGAPEAGCLRGDRAACRTLALESGAIEVWLELEQTQ